MLILITGCNGYIGNAVTQKMLVKGHKVVGVDNNVKNKWLKELNSVSAIDVPKNRKKELQKWYDNFEFYKLDIYKEVQKLEKLFQKYRFDTIINLAQMPSAPYSQIDLKHASWTIQNNSIGTLNILWLIKEYCPDTHLVEIESMGTFKPDINTDIPENKFQFTYNGRVSEPCLFPKEVGSYYHSSKLFNTYLNDCANRWWDIKSTIINQGVVYGNYTNEIEETDIHSHLSVDESFGTVINRFIVQAMLQYPLTIYGSGNHKRGFLALNDSVQCLDLLVHNPPEEKEMRIINQLDEVYSINEVADKVLFTLFGNNKNKQYIESPRAENTEDFYYNPHTDILKSLNFRQTRTIEDEVKFAYENINRKRLSQLKNLILPNIYWR